MTHEVIMAGFGGQGVMSMGQLLAYAGMAEGKKVSWIPSYGPEQRGGTANCSVIVSEADVASPIVIEPTSVIIMNQPSLDKFEDQVVPGGVMIVNSSLCTRPARRKDLTVVSIPTTEIALELGNTKIANIVALGAFLELTGAVKFESVEAALKKVLPEHRHNLIPLNKQALEKGAEFARKQMATRAG